MFKGRLVLVAIDHAADVERTLTVALSAAKAHRADVHVIRVEPDSRVHVDERLGRWAFEPLDQRGVTIGARLASILRSADQDGVHVQSVTLRGEPEHVIPVACPAPSAGVSYDLPGYCGPERSSCEAIQ